MKKIYLYFEIFRLLFKNRLKKFIIFYKNYFYNLIYKRKISA